MPASVRPRTDVFFDTNVLLYRAADEDDPRTARADALLEEGGVVSAHVLGEFASVMRSKRWQRPWKEVCHQLEAIRANTVVLPVTVETHAKGLAYAERYKLQYFDALHIASAVLAGCTTLWSEDMQDGLKIDGLTVRNPFRA